jgi:hypothetical protein
MTTYAERVALELGKDFEEAEEQSSHALDESEVHNFNHKGADHVQLGGNKPGQWLQSDIDCRDLGIYGAGR